MDVVFTEVNKDSILIGKPKGKLNETEPNSKVDSVQNYQQFHIYIDFLLDRKCKLEDNRSAVEPRVTTVRRMKTWKNSKNINLLPYISSFHSSRELFKIKLLKAYPLEWIFCKNFKSYIFIFSGKINYNPFEFIWVHSYQSNVDSTIEYNRQSNVYYQRWNDESVHDRDEFEQTTPMVSLRYGLICHLIWCKDRHEIYLVSKFLSFLVLHLSLQEDNFNSWL